MSLYCNLSDGGGNRWNRARNMDKNKAFWPGTWINAGSLSSRTFVDLTGSTLNMNLS